MDFSQYNYGNESSDKTQQGEIESLKEQLILFEKIVISKNSHIEDLEKKLTEIYAYKSEFDLQNNELNDIGALVVNLHQNIESTNLQELFQTNLDPDIKNLLLVIQQKISSLTSQVSELQNQLQIIQERNLLLQKHNIRLGELESILSISTENEEEL
jgi:hypothetical protein